MRKFAIPKYMYVLLVLMIGVLSIGYTYAYFSSTYQADANLQLGYINVVWCDADSGEVINGVNNEISITAQELDCGALCDIQIPTEEEGVMQKIALGISNKDATVSAYYRLKIDARYTPEGETESKECGEKWIELAYDTESGGIDFLEGGDWFYDDGYYYCGTDDGTTKTLTAIDAGEDKLIANYICLGFNIDVDVYGSSMSIVLTIESVQTTNNAYRSVWGVDW